MKEIEQILGAIERVTGVKPTPFSTTQRYAVPAINYTFYRTNNDGAVARYKLQLRIIDRSLSSALGVDEAIQKELVTLGDETKFNCVIAQNGGGSLEDPSTGLPQIITYFDILKRSL